MKFCLSYVISLVLVVSVECISQDEPAISQQIQESELALEYPEPKGSVELRNGKCQDIRGDCLPKRSARRLCKGTIDKMFKCDNRNELCCITEPYNQCLVQHAENSILWQKVESATSDVKEIIKDGNRNIRSEITTKIAKVESDLESVTLKLDYIIGQLGRLCCPTTIPSTEVKTTTTPIITTPESTTPAESGPPSTTPTPTGNCTNNNGTEISYGGLSYCLKRNCTTWNATKDWCEGMDMVMAQPKNPNGLATYINSLGLRCSYWLGGFGNGFNQVWLNGTVISNKDPLWYKYPNVHTEYCLTLITCSNLTQTLFTYNCQKSCGYRLCQVKTTTSPIITTPESTTPASCPGGFFRAGNSRYLMLNDIKRNFTDAQAKCAAENGFLAEPQDPLPVRIALVETCGYDDYVFLGGRGNGSTFIWQHDNSVLSNTSPYWRPQKPGRLLTSRYCLFLLSTKWNLAAYPTQPYWIVYCYQEFYALCELF